MELRRLIVYLIFAVTVIYGIYFHFLSGHDVEISVKNTPQIEYPADSIDSPGNRPAELRSTGDPEETVPLDWRRNPFRGDGGTDGAVAKDNPVSGDFQGNMESRSSSEVQLK